MYIFNSGIKFDRNLFRVPAVTHVCFYSIFLYVYLRVFAFGLFFISLQYYTKSGYSTQPVVLVHVCGPEYTCISLCVSACVPCVWQRALLRTGRSDCDISSTLTLHTTHLHFANSPRLTLQLFSLSFPFSPLTFPVSLSLIIIVVLPLFFLSKLPEFLVASVWAVAQNANGAVFASLWGDKDKRWTEKIYNRLGRSEYKQINMTALSRCARGLGDVCLEGVLGEPGRRSATAA